MFILSYIGLFIFNLILISICFLMREKKERKGTDSGRLEGEGYLEGVGKAEIITKIYYIKISILIQMNKII